MKTQIELQLGIINGDDKRALENYIDSRAFIQRKSFDEYYCDWTNIELDIDLNDLMILAEHCKVKVFESCVILTGH